VLLSTLVSTSTQVAATSGRLAKIKLLADLLKQAGGRPDEIELVIAYLSGTIRQSKVGVGWATLQKARSRVAKTPGLEIGDVDATLEAIAKTTGKGSAGEKQRLLGELFGRATQEEQDFLFRLLTGELRQGALEGIMVEALAQARGLAANDVRRAVMLAGDVGAVAKGDIASFKIELFRPLKPMLAKTAENVAEALAELGPAAFEYKLDGIRIQVHKRAREVRIYSRTLNDITGELPGIVDISRNLEMSDGILDGEAIVLVAGRPVRFQETMKGLGGGIPFFFDILYINGTSLLEQPYSTRATILAEHVPQSRRPPRLVTADAKQAQDFFDAALAAGQEGLVAKGLQSTYEAGRRGGAWFKVKQANTLDLVVLAAEWGHGRRHGKLSNLHLGARDPENGGFVMLGKTFKGMTDEMLEWQTKRLQELETHRDGIVVYVRPELVVEIAFNGLQDSLHYPGGLALRFARVVRYREDKKPEDADTIQTVRKLHGT
jgi:ATP-dependent DNA ligase I